MHDVRDAEQSQTNERLTRTCVCVFVWCMRRTLAGGEAEAQGGESKGGEGESGGEGGGGGGGAGLDGHSYRSFGATQRDSVRAGLAG